MTDVRSLSDAELSRLLAQPQGTQPTPAQKPVQDLSDDELRTALGNTSAEGSGIFMNATAGLNSGIYGALGAPVDAATWAVNKGIQGINALTGAGLPEARNDLPGSSRSLATGFNAAGVAKPEDVIAASPEERIARGVGEGVGYTVGPQAMIGGALRAGLGEIAPRTADALGKLTGQTSSAATTIGNAFAGGAAGAGSAAAMEFTPPDSTWRGMAGLGGGLAGTGVGSLVAAAPAMASSARRVAGEFLDPFTTAGRDRAAGRELRDAATEPGTARQAIETAPDELIPGSRPTTFQASGDMGLGALERRMQTQDPEPFMTRRAEQNSARLGALGDIQPGGHPEAVSKAFRGRLAEIDAETENALTAATEAARGRAQALGGNQPADVYGDALRGSLAQAREAAKVRERALWAAVDPENRLDVPLGNAREAARRISSERSTLATPLSADEASIFATARALPENARLNDVSAFRSRLSEAMTTERRANGQSAAYARLAQLRGAVQNDLEGVIARRAAAEEQAVAAGQMREEDTMMARWKAALGVDRERWISARREGAGESRLAGGGAVGSSRTGDVFGGYGSEGASGGGFASAPRDPGVSAPAGLPFDDAARERLSAATAATRERAQTFDRGVTGQVLRRPMATGPYDIGPSSVPARIFAPGAASADRIAQFRQAAGDAQALDVLQDYAASQIRKAAKRPDGTLDPERVAAWRRNHADALRAFPDLDARFADAGRASQAMAEAATARRIRLEDYQRGIVGRIIGATDPGDVTRLVGGVFSRQDASSTMESLAGAVRGNPDAREGMRKAVADYIAGRFVGNTEAATTGEGLLKSDGFQTFMAQNRRALAHVLSGDEIATLDRIALDLQRSNRSLTAVRIPGQSNTAQDTFAVRETDTPMAILSKLAATSAAAGAGGFAALGPVGGFVGAVGAPAFAALRQYGVRRVEDVIRDAMLDPELAKRLLAPVGSQGADALRSRLLDYYRAGAGAGAATTFDSEAPQHPDITVTPRRQSFLPVPPAPIDDTPRGRVARALLAAGGKRSTPIGSPAVQRIAELLVRQLAA